MKVYPNPYHCLDHTGRLAGACPMEPTHRAGMRTYVCASLVSLNRAELNDNKTLDADTRDAREHHGFVFSAEPLAITADPGWYYMQRARAEEVFMPRDGKPPMAQWAAVRWRLVTDWRARFGSDPPVDKWAEQWPLDAQIAAFKSVDTKAEKGGAK